MKRLRKIEASNVMPPIPDVRFTPEQVRDLLSEMTELSDYEIALAESFNGIEFIVGSSVYLVPIGENGEVCMI